MQRGGHALWSYRLHSHGARVCMHNGVRVMQELSCRQDRSVVLVYVRVPNTMVGGWLRDVLRWICKLR